MNTCTIPRDTLLEALDAVKGCVATKTFSPILTHVLFDDTYVFAFDSEVGVRFKLKAPIGVTFNVRFDTLFSLVTAFDGAEVTFEIEKQHVVIKCGKHRSRLAQVLDQYPEPPPLEELPAHDVPLGFKDALERCLVAASSVDTEKMLSSVLVKWTTMYATDRASVVRCQFAQETPLPTMLLSRKSVTEIIRLGQPGKVLTNGNWSLWDYGNLTFVAALREGAEGFPPIDQLVQRLGLPEVDDMNKIPEGFSACLTRLSLFLSKKDFRVTTRDTAMAFELVAKAENGECVEYLEKIENPPSGKGFDPERLAAALKYAEFIDWGKDHKTPIYLRGVDCNFEFLLSPMTGA